MQTNPFDHLRVDINAAQHPRFGDFNSDYRLHIPLESVERRVSEWQEEVRSLDAEILLTESQLQEIGKLRTSLLQTKADILHRRPHLARLQRQ
ncbi:MAG: hypothetical protein KVP17_002129 [Porospora cf. gigantea B]|uniref:uncharacterized protein n=1 Tax=Porospora cf. gigantea B TaxID=2853592 RepID=UPI003571A1AE|nr:MAG: hypothetical protein KVP17_002129 [Porospora cf. gigantea B]